MEGGREATTIGASNDWSSEVKRQMGKAEGALWNLWAELSGWKSDLELMIKRLDASLSQVLGLGQALSNLHHTGHGSGPSTTKTTVEPFECPSRKTRFWRLNHNSGATVAQGPSCETTSKLKGAGTPMVVALIAQKSLPEGSDHSGTFSKSNSSQDAPLSHQHSRSQASETSLLKQLNQKWFLPHIRGQWKSGAC